MKNNQFKDIWYPAIAGFCAFFIGIGLGRFAYTPLIPALIHQDGFSVGDTSWLGSINFMGYLLGAFLGTQLKKFMNPALGIKIALVLSVLSFAFCMFNFGFIWLGAWRFLIGITGAVLMILTPSLVLKKVPGIYRGRVAGIMFTGMGFGVILAGFVLPYLANLNLIYAWLAAAVLSLLAVLISWKEFSNFSLAHKNQVQNLAIHLNQNFPKWPVILLAMAYGLVAIGAVPHSLFLVNYVHQELKLDLVRSGFFWSIFGLGALIGPFLSGVMVDKLGAYKSLILIFIASCVVLPLLLFNQISFLYAASAFFMGMFFPGIVTILSARLIELVGSEHYPSTWGRMALYYSLTQALASGLMSYLLKTGFSYTGCFLIAEGAFLIASVLVFMANVDTQE